MLCSQLLSIEYNDILVTVFFQEYSDFHKKAYGFKLPLYSLLYDKFYDGKDGDLELYRIWKELNTPPYIGKSKEGIVDDFTKLKNEDTSKLRKDGDDYYEYIISNDWRYGSSCNQFQPGLHKTRIDGISLWDILENDDYEFSREIVRWFKIPE